MKIEFYAIDFWAIETLRNGKERETTQTVYFPKRDEHGKLTHWTEITAMERAEMELKKQRYYKLIYKGCRTVRMNVIVE